MIYHDDEWKIPRLEKPSVIKGRTREQEQAHIDTAFCSGRMGLVVWREKTDELSELTKWCKDGKLT